jgi:hypothetical protein
LYAQYNWSKKYFVNQPITNVFRWTAVFTVAGLSIGHLIFLIADYPYFLISPQLYGSMIGLAIGGVTGLSIGFSKGLHYYKRGKKDMETPIKKCRLGYMFSIENAPFDGSLKNKKFKGMLRGDSDTGVDFFIIYRTLSYNRFIPDKVECGWGTFDWGRGSSDYSKIPYYMWSEFYKVELNTLYSPFIRPFYSLNFGLGMGYCWGEERVRYDEYTKKKKKIQSVFFKVITEIEFNFFDFFFNSISINYEPIGIYQQFMDNKHYPYIQNLTFRVTAGAYIF